MKIKNKIIKFIKENKGLLIFYIIMFVVILLWCEKVENTNDKMNEHKNINYYERQQEQQEKQVIYQELKRGVK
jgi:hypothetical protein